MENAAYTALTRQSGLMREMQVVANNIANAATTGYRQQGVVFSEHVKRLEGADSLSMAAADIRTTSQAQGSLTRTGGTFDLAIEGEGFFAVETPEGERLTRAGSFTPNGQGDLVTNDGYRVLDAGGAPVFVPPDAAGLSVAADGTLSADGRPLAQIGLVRPVGGAAMSRTSSQMFDPGGATEPVETGRIVQGFLEDSNVDPIGQVARMIEVQRAYEIGQSFLQSENERIRAAVKTLVK